jgi:hypothetical protein
MCALNPDILNAVGTNDSKHITLINSLVESQHSLLYGMVPRHLINEQ